MTAMQIEWLGQSEITAENAVDVLRAEVPCYSRKIDDCLYVPNEELQRRGIFDAECERIAKISKLAPAEDITTWAAEMPYCPGYFEQPKKKERAPQIIAGIGIFMLGAALGRLL